MKKYFLTLLTSLSYFVILAQNSGENALIIEENYPETYAKIKSLAIEKYGSNKTMKVHELNEQSKSILYFIAISETIDSNNFYSALKMHTKDGITDWPKLEYEYKKQSKKPLDKGGVELYASNPYININTQKKINLEEFGLLGKVKSIKETSYRMIEKFGDSIKEKHRREKYVEKDFYLLFNKRGKIIKEYKYESDGSLYSEYKYKYNNRDKIKVCKGTTRLMSFLRPISYYYFFENDSIGNIIEENYFQSNDLNLIYKYSYKYDGNNNQIEGSYYRSNENLESKSKYDYNEKGNLIDGSHFRSDGVLESITKYNYDDNDNLVEWHRYNTDGSLAYQGEYQYNSNGNVIEGEGYTYEYEYDEIGNWILKTEFRNKIKGYTIEREIEYFR